jgi:hypothetical protein
MKRAYYQQKIDAFLATSPSEILGELSKGHQFSLENLQRNAWIEQIPELKNQLRRFGDGYIFLEFSIPRMGKRVDVLLLIGGIVFVVEYKVGADSYQKYAVDQVLDYALDLKNFSRRQP